MHAVDESGWWDWEENVGIVGLCEAAGYHSWSRSEKVFLAIAVRCTVVNPDELGIGFRATCAHFFLFYNHIQLPLRFLNLFFFVLV
jgi:hypothetical protein